MEEVQLSTRRESSLGNELCLQLGGALPACLEIHVERLKLGHDVAKRSGQIQMLSRETSPSAVSLGKVSFQA